MTEYHFRFDRIQQYKGFIFMQIELRIETICYSLEVYKYLNENNKMYKFYDEKGNGLKDKRLIANIRDALRRWFKEIF